MGEYKITKLGTTGAVVEGVDLADCPAETRARIRRDLQTHSLLLFKDQYITPEAHVELSRWFGHLFLLPKPEMNAQLPGDVFSVPSSPHPSIFCVSNDARFGSTGVGVAGWHNDGLVFQKPFAHSIYHMVSVPSVGGGCTQFADLHQALSGLSATEKEEWNRVYLRNLGNGVVHPLMYRHPVTKKEVLCLGLGSWAGLGNHVKAYSRDLNGEDLLSEEEADALENRIISLLERPGILYNHVWSEGEVIVSDNLAVAHKASKDTQRPSSEVGLRLLHRISVLGTHEPLSLKKAQLLLSQ